MHYWIQTLGVLAAALLSVCLGWWLSHLKKQFWLFGFFAALGLLLITIFSTIYTAIYFLPPFCWINRGRTDLVLISITIPMLFTILMPQIKNKRLNILLTILIAISSIYYLIGPFLLPFFVKNSLSGLQSTIENGVCIQSTGYNCGPAAAVTALRQLGIEAQEGQIAIASYTEPITGTDEYLLSRAIEKLYKLEGIRCHIQRFKSVEELKGHCPVIAVVKFSFLVDHYVAVIDVLEDKIVIGDPIEGRQSLSFRDFENRWRSFGIVVGRDGT